MVLALLADRKSQTRRLATSPLRKCEPGDRLYVRETWSHDGVGVWTIADARRRLNGRPIYRATHDGPSPLSWWPSIHMPREFSRLSLIVEAVRVEPLQAISEADAIAEGIQLKHRDSSPVIAYKTLWRLLHGAESWDANPDVVVISFNVRRGNIDRQDRPQ